MTRGSFRLEGDVDFGLIDSFVQVDITSLMLDHLAIAVWPVSQKPSSTTREAGMSKCCASARRLHPAARVALSAEIRSFLATE